MRLKIMQNVEVSNLENLRGPQGISKTDVSSFCKNYLACYVAGKKEMKPGHVNPVSLANAKFY